MADAAVTTPTEVTAAPTQATEPAPDPRLAALLAATPPRKAKAAPAPAATAAPESSAVAATETSPAEPATGEVPSEESTTDPAIATSWAELNRRDAALKEQAAALKTQQRDLDELAQIRSARSDPLRLLQALGYNRTQILDAVIAQGDGQQSQPVDTRQFVSREEADAKVNAVKAELSEHNRIRYALARSDSELLKLAADSENGDRVVEEILLAAADEFARTRQRPDYAEIIKQKEAEYERQTFSLLEFLGRSTKVKDRLAGQATTPGNSNPPPPGPSAKPQQKQQQALPPATLSNDMQTEPATHRERPRTVEEKRAAFVQAIADGWKKSKQGGGPSRP